MPPAQITDFGPSTQQQFDTASRDALPSGTRLGGYQIIDVVGRGRYSIVYLVLDSSLQRQMAIKEYLPFALAERRGHTDVVLKAGADTDAYASGLADFLSEGNLLTRLDHPSIARVHSFWEENNTAYMVMPYYAGQTLTATLKAMPRPPDEAWLRALLAPLLSGLNVLHSVQCYHRNITPDNIFILEDGRPVLLDFSASNRVIGDKTVSLASRLNPAYAAIEQYPQSATLSQGPWTDLYALAAVLHFAITRQVPALATVRAINDPQRPLAETMRTLQKLFLGLHYSEAFLTGIDKALSVKPRDRPRNAADFMLSLDRPPNVVVAPLPDPLGTPSAFIPRGDSVFQASQMPNDWVMPERSVHVPPRRSRAPLWIAALCTIALAATGGWWWTQQMHPAASRSAADAPPSPSAVAAAPTTPAPLDAPAPAVTDALESSPIPVPASATVQVERPSTAASEMAAAPAPAAPTPVAPAPMPPEDTPPVAETPVAATPAPAPAPEPAPAKKVAKAPVAPAEPDNPRAVCGPRSNFSLLYCMQTQCNRPKFAQHAQCLVLKRQGEIN
jgi:serine/threonine protein kinase